MAVGALRTFALTLLPSEKHGAETALPQFFYDLVFIKVVVIILVFPDVLLVEIETGTPE